MSNNQDTQSTLNKLNIDINKINNNIRIKKTQKKTAEKRNDFPKYKDQSKTDENYMDYNQDTNGKFVVIYDGFDEMVLVHEVLHCMSLKHSFGSVREHSFKALKTENIMDYNIEGTSDRRESLWKWQWEKLWEWHQNK
ncbi:hypothetical protein [uncultured Marixanthomonas sp.]|uniref:hypothetical protein n=1 Tax=uncultured Marixanthomonas sp. TaxID=757245 RepID=UPI0030DD7EC1